MITEISRFLGPSKQNKLPHEAPSTFADQTTVKFVTRLSLPLFFIH